MDITESNLRIAIIGGGSMATAIAKMLQSNSLSFNWYMRKRETIKKFKELGHNPSYLSAVRFNINKIKFYNNLNKCAENSDLLIFVIPAAFMHKGLENLTTDISEKYIVSATKGISPETGELASQYFINQHQISMSNFGVIKGPCHAEEIALERLSYLTIASENNELATVVTKILGTAYTKLCTSNDVLGTEYAAVLKNVMAIASGVAYGLRYGDNFQAVLISNAIKEMKRFLDVVVPQERDIKDSVYLGDLLVTTYSQFSRNRTFGTMIGRGYTVKSAILELSMVAEGYYAVKSIYDIMMELDIHMPITKAVYLILHERIAPSIEMKILSDELQ
ncbi:glycerol-3-phosphate dehydrogenase (NAD(P)+) [Balneicella halophila]|uniref:Glycerol-3-phosphate dehydrogenase n=1 Tax=Balneicella halophila TaxID=1537566 RepID=A0A7L4URZ4_BALHA|nr:NAD(P)H-dependent glycerol-3-phosphate dehydrogenase [Balneicella halophila]PVX52530.1 glycerol-3-phosphate dehydrogenase (NAD(P)+) [Balneicella halophila]